MLSLQKVGGFAALFEAAAFIVGFWFYATVLEPARYGAATVDAVRHVAFLAANQSMLLVWNFVIYVAFGAALVVVTLALQHRVKSAAPGLAKAGAAFGLIWAGLVIASGMIANIGMGVIVDLNIRDPAQAATVWQAYKIMVAGLGGGNEIVGGLWVLLTSVAALRSAALPKLLNYFGGIIGIAGLLTTIPALEMLGSVFGLGLILWFAWVGFVLLRGTAANAAGLPQP